MATVTVIDLTNLPSSPVRSASPARKRSRPPPPSTVNTQKTPRVDKTPAKQETPTDTRPNATHHEAGNAQSLNPTQRVPIYLQAFEEMLSIVMEHEHFLFNDAEIRVLTTWHLIPYESRYLFVRLFLRKEGWFRRDKISYFDDIGNLQGACDDMCRAIDAYSSHAPFNPAEAVPHTSTSLALSPTSSDAGSSLLQATESCADLSHYARISDSQVGIEELLPIVSLEELRRLARDMKVNRPGTTKDDIAAALKKATSCQATLLSHFPTLKGKEKASNSSLSLTFSTNGVKQSQNSILMAKLLKIIGPCIKLNPCVTQLFTRLHLIFHRSFSLNEKTMTASMLARFKIRNYPTYVVKRTFSIFNSRRQLLQYETALELEKQIEICLGDSPETWKTNVLKKSASRKLDDSAVQKLKEEEVKRREEALKRGLDIFEGAWKIWNQLIEELDQVDQQLRLSGQPSEDEQQYRLTYYRKRFHPGWPLARVIYKGAYIMSRFHQHEREVEVLENLLNQQHFRRGKRGTWYERLALVLMNHIGKESDEERQVARQRALAVCERALTDPWTHSIYHSSLQKRLTKLQSTLKISEEDKFDFSNSTLKIATSTTLQGERLSDSLIGKKSIWRSKDGSEVSVEELSLEHYCQQQGWKGFHSENGILTTIFCLLFWDVIFAPVDGVFEHAYQSAPLDLATDAFSIVRMKQVSSRLREIERGQGNEILRVVDERERSKNTWCIGVKWEYTFEDLSTIVESLGGRALACICRVFAEEWGHRIGGTPDLCIFNAELKLCRFVEVKGPGDRLSETQKVWIDLLLAAGVEVELCTVVNIDEYELLHGSKPTKRKQK